MTDLKLSKNADSLNKSTYWNSCPLKNQFLPEELCQEGSNSDKSGCQWYVVSKEHNNCFWKFIKDRSYADGSMPEMSQSEVATLFGWSNAKVHFVFKEAMDALVEKLTTYNLNNKDEDILDSEIFADLIDTHGFKPVD